MIRKIALISYYGPICSLFGDDFFVKGFENLKEHFKFFQTDGLKGQMLQRSLKNEAGQKRFVCLAVATKQFTT